MSLESTIPTSDEGASEEKVLSEAKDARRRAMERARTMHSFVHRKKDEMDVSKKNAIRSHSTSHRRRIPRKSSTRRSGKLNRRSSIGNNSSISSISELEAVITFNDDGSAASSISQLTGSFNSIHSAFVNSCVTQGPSVFETKAVEKRSCTAPRMPSRAISKRQLDCDESNDESNSSLSLEDIKEDVTTTTGTMSPEATREWTVSSHRKTQEMNMPVRVGSIPEIDADMKELCRDWVEKRSSESLGIYMPDIGAGRKATGREWAEGRPSNTTGINMPIRVGSMADMGMEFNSESDSSLSLSQSGSTVTGVSFFSEDNLVPLRQRQTHCAM